MRFSISSFVHRQIIRSKKASKESTETVSNTAASSSPSEISIFDLIKNAEKELKVSKLNDWYKISSSSFVKSKWGRLIKRQGLSLHQALKQAYKDHNWEDWRFKRNPTGVWKDLNTQRSFFKSLGNLHGIDESCLEKWYRMDPKTVEESGGAPSASMPFFFFFLLEYC